MVVRASTATATDDIADLQRLPIGLEGFVACREAGGKGTEALSDD